MVRLVIRKNFFTVSAVKHWNVFPIDIVDFPGDVLDGTLSNLL